MKGEKVELRAIEPGDISLLYEWENDKNHWYISNTVAPFSRFVLEQYIMANDPVTKEAKATELQRILYEDLPAISVLYFRDIYGMQQDVTQIDPNLLVTLHHRPEYWDTSDHLLVYAIPVLFKEENIFKLTSYEDGLWMKTVYGGLVGYEQNSHDFAPIIAKNYTVNLSDKTILVNINSNAKFSDGNPVTAEDVKYSYELYMELTLGYGSYSEITEFLENNNSIEIVDADTLVFHLKKLDACVEELLTYGIIEKAKVEHVIEQYGYDIFKEPPLTGHVNDTLVTSCGPFVLKSYNETAIELIPNAYYVGQTPKLAKLIFRIVDNEALLKSEIKAGNIDIVDKSYEITQAEYEEEYPSMQIVVSKAFTNHELAINMKHPIFGTGELTPAGTEEAAKYVRKALSYAIDREGIINFGRSDDLRELPVPGISPMPEGCKSFDYNLQPYSYNVSLALEYLQKAGFQVTIPNTTSPTTQQATSEILVLLMAFVSVAIIEKSKKY